MNRPSHRRTLACAAIALFLTALTAPPAEAVGACNGVGCWAMKIFSIKSKSDNGDIWVTFETDTIDPLHDGGSFNGCRVRLVPMQGNHPALLLRATVPGADQILAQLLLAFASGQAVGIGIAPSDWIAGDGVPFCALNSIYFFRTGCNSATATCS